MKKILSILMALSLYTASPVASADGHLLDEGNFSANVAYTSNYLFRGLSLSNDNSAVSGGFDWGYNGFYLGTWASSISPVETETAEIDFYGGYGNEFAGVSWSVDWLYYFYPGEADTGDAGDSGADLDYWEFGGSLGYSFTAPWDPTVGLSVLYSPDFFGETGDATAIEASFDLTLAYDIGLGFHYGYQDLDASLNGISGYNYYGINVSKTVGIFDITIGYSDTDSDGQTFAGDPTDELVFTVGASF